MPPCGVGLKYPVCFVVGSRRLIIQSRLDPPPRIRGISAPSQSRPLLGQAPSGLTYTQFCRLCFGWSEQAGQVGQVGQVIFWGVIAILINEYGGFWSKLANLAKLCRGRGRLRREGRLR